MRGTAVETPLEGLKMITELEADYKSVGRKGVLLALQGFPLIHQVAYLPHERVVTADDLFG